MDQEPRASITIKLSGDYDLSRKEELAQLFHSLDGGVPIVLDLNGVTYIDSTILRELAILRLRDERRSITLTGARPDVRHILNIVNFHRLFIIED